MKSKVGTTTTPPPPECCMCGDYGLPTELFQCKVCLSRSQHKYCSDLYLKAESYDACNWCLRAAEAATLKNQSTLLCSSNNTNSGSMISGNSTSSGLKINRTAFSSNIHKPVKKQRVPQVLRGRVRRYKLLEEVSS
ncbi:hypothetical protein J5N97_009584 [Dioscorea zingiberensis]|uniref:PHD-type zinc finger plants domain-containing protein n=1 Tax=Dioscorea zingiberensis TaxID=325984 RepID=A0A9D5CYI5_9LILI|nr:hypothetical protein J5N97_009584 [Dioscorea zingiberensis]